ncbi:uncharacterized protein C8R40DRAFT_1120426 [Lentinula edodes]|uniref:uncharacterized protein n=1 Tax=Lentinula edodes TaxID=5353 RepID=UPI001E8CBA73|nr:uncharacterized protein C8R40DRAFT_1120426 [Lentinula edodes]KAH7871841.1 hypothetical protein C8R40DRAFT_1120426 [Lentinula edodes]
MALRRFAQANNASTASPNRSGASSNASPVSVTPGLPVTPKPRGRVSIGIHQSPASTPSLSSSIPFDWEAARSRRPPPYASPSQNRSRGGRNSGSNSSSLNGTPARKAVVKKKSIVEKVTSIPSQIAFEISQFPNNVPLPTPRTSACVIGGFLHFLHLCVRVSQARSAQSSDLEWNEMLRETEGRSWFDWTMPMTLFLIAASVTNAVYTFTRIKLYRLYRRVEPVSSPNAKFVDSDDLDFDKLEPPSLAMRFRAGAWNALIAFWRFLLGLKPSTKLPSSTRKSTRVQQLQIWTPGDLEMMLFNIYSPVHALLWMATNSSNWIIMLLIMGTVGLQLNTMMLSYKTLIKDKDILHAEVMNEYNEGFVYPRINPIRKDVAIMTHQSEVVNVWED